MVDPGLAVGLAAWSQGESLGDGGLVMMLSVGGMEKAGRTGGGESLVMMGVAARAVHVLVVRKGAELGIAGVQTVCGDDQSPLLASS